MVDRYRVYKRPLLKLSGEAFGDRNAGTNHDHTSLPHMANEIALAHATGIKLGIVCGGGNLARGAELEKHGIDRRTGDLAGMLCTAVNALILRDILVSLVKRPNDSMVRIQSAIEMSRICETFSQGRLVKHLDNDRIVIFATGTGNPFCTTDSAASLRACEMDADVLLMAKSGIDGVYTADPKLDPSAELISRMTYDDLFAMGPGVMDLAAVEQCRSQKIPIIVFNLMKPGNLAKALDGAATGTLISF